LKNTTHVQLIPGPIFDLHSKIPTHRVDGLQAHWKNLSVEVLKSRHLKPR